MTKQCYLAKSATQIVSQKYSQNGLAEIEKPIDFTNVSWFLNGRTVICFWNTVHSPFVTFCKFFTVTILCSCCSILMLHFFRVALSSCFTFSMLHFPRVAPFQCTFSVLHSFHVLLFLSIFMFSSCCTFFILHFFHVALF